jgi:hypothetical protein
MLKKNGSSSSIKTIEQVREATLMDVKKLLDEARKSK